jgi:dolichol-phosphate mannosyltransferase
VFSIDGEPNFGSMPGRSWDLPDWYAAPGKAERLLNWTAKTDLADGLRLTSEWIGSLGGLDLATMTKRAKGPRRRSISAIVACYRDEQAIPIMHRRLTDTFLRLAVDYEIIFVNDGSPDDCAGRILEISATDPHVVGITHSRNFGSQMAFRSGMEMSVMEACVLLDGDLQDPPELIEHFYQRWIDGYDVVYGRRVKRDMPRAWGMMYKAFYRIFAMMSYIDESCAGSCVARSGICFCVDCALTSASARSVSIISGQSACSARARTICSRIWSGRSAAYFRSAIRR